MAQCISIPQMTPSMDDDFDCPSNNERLFNEFGQPMSDNECLPECEFLIPRPPEVCFTKKIIFCKLPVVAPRVVKKPVSILVPKPVIYSKKVKTPGSLLTARVIRYIKYIAQKQIIKIPQVRYYRTYVPYKREVYLPKLCFPKPLRICVPKQNHKNCDYECGLPIDCNPNDPCKYPFYPCYPSINCPDQYTNSNIPPLYPSPHPNPCFPNPDLYFPYPNPCYPSFSNINFDLNPRPHPYLSPHFSKISFIPNPGI